MRIARHAINGREARTRSASKNFRQDVRGRNTQGTFDEPLARVTGIFDHVFGKPLTWIADKFTYTFDPLLTASKGASKGRLCYPPFTGVHRWVNTAFTAFDLGGKGAFKDDLWCASKIIKSVQRWPFTTHLMRGQGDFSCREALQRLIAPMPDAIFLAIFSMCIVHERFSSIFTPRDLTELTCLIALMCDDIIQA